MTVKNFKLLIIKMAEKNVEANIWKARLLTIIQRMAFFMPLMVLFWQENGLSLTEIMVLQSICSVVMVFLEIPSGYFADVFSRKSSLIISAMSLLFSVIIYSFSYSFVGFLVAELFWAVAGAFASGADAALVYDSLKEVGREREYKKIWGSINFWGFLSVAFGGIVGGWLGSIELRWTLYAMIPTFALLLPFSLALKEPKRHKAIIKKGYITELLKALKSVFSKNVKLRGIIIYSAVIFIFNQAGLWFYQPYMKSAGLALVYFGFASLTFNLVAALSSRYAYFIEKKLSTKSIFILLPLLTAISSLLFGNFLLQIGFVFAFLQQFVRGVRGPIFIDYINKLVPSKNRATILSVESFIGRLGYAAIIPLIGWVADVYTLQQAFIVLGVTTLIVCSFVFFILQRQKIF